MTIASIACDVTGHGSEGDQETMWLSLMAFADQAAALAKCKAGESVSVIGRLTRSRYLKDGEERESWSCMVDGLMTARTARPGQRSAKASDGDTRRAAPRSERWESSGDDLAF
jgi:single-stranded DNA-binding protein